MNQKSQNRLIFLLTNVSLSSIKVDSTCNRYWVNQKSQYRLIFLHKYVSISSINIVSTFNLDTGSYFCYEMCLFSQTEISVKAHIFVIKYVNFLTLELIQHVIAILIQDHISAMRCVYFLASCSSYWVIRNLDTWVLWLCKPKTRQQGDLTFSKNLLIFCLHPQQLGLG